MATIEGEEAFFYFFLIFRINQFASFCQIFSSQVTLFCHDALYIRSEIFKQLGVSILRNRTRDDKRRAGIVNQNRVNLIDNGIIMLALNQVLWASCHIVAQVVETKLVIGTKGNIGHICIATSNRVGLVLVNTIYTQTVEHIKRTHPFCVSFCQVVVDCNHVNAVAS